MRSGSIARRPNGRWRARYRDAAGKEHARHFTRRIDAQLWLDEVTTAMTTGRYTDPRTARLTVAQWCDMWLEGYQTNRPSSIRQAKVHIAQIKAGLGALPMVAVRPSHIRTWTSQLHGQRKAPSYIYALHGRLSQILAAAVRDGIIPQSACSRHTSPGQGGQRPYVATTKQVWNLHASMPPRLRIAVLLGAFAGLRAGEACGLRPGDLDFAAGMLHPRVQWPAEPLKTVTSQTAIPLPGVMVTELVAHMARWPGETVLVGQDGGQLPPWALERAHRTARKKVPGLPEGFRYHDLRHYFASLLIASGSDVKVVQARLRHALAKTTLDCYAHLWPDRDNSTRSAVEAVFAEQDQTYCGPGAD